MRVRILALSVMSGRIAHAVFDGDRLISWAISRKGAVSLEDFETVVGGWIDDFSPVAVVSEKLMASSKKSGRSVELLAAVDHVVERRKLLLVRIVRPRRFKNKYLEAEDLVTRFPGLASRQPKRDRFYDNEPISTAIFEAVALGLQVSRDPTRHLARALG